MHHLSPFQPISAHVKLIMFLSSSIDVCYGTKFEFTYNTNLRASQRMSFFEQKGNDSNLQYDDVAFIFFVASAFVIAAIFFFILIIRHLRQLAIPNTKQILQAPYLQSKLNNLKQYKRQQLLNGWLWLKIVIFIILVLCVLAIINKSKDFKGNLKGFDPYEILGLKQGATLKEIKKAYRQLAREFHPDKNNGNPQAQSKFILISKSYQCFTDEKKKQSCFKYGNPDGAETFRVGIGLPAIFVKLQYKWVVLPLILITFLVIIPLLALRWSNKQFMKDFTGISILSFSKLLKCIDKNCNKFSIICLLSSYKETYEYLGYGPISQQNKDRLFTQLDRYPDSKKQFVQDFTDDQLYIYWQVYKYMAGLGEFIHPEFQQVVEKYMYMSLEMMKIFTDRQMDGSQLYGNPEWKIVFLGTSPIEAFCAFTRDYYNRTLAPDQKMAIWMNNLDFAQEERILGERANISNQLFLTLKSKGYEPFVKLFGTERQASIRNQMQNLPVYHIDAKLKVDKRQVNKISAFDYCQVFFKVSRQNKTNGYSVLSNYPFPKKEKLLLIVLSDENILHQEFIQFSNEKDSYISKFDMRAGQSGVKAMNFLALSEVHHHIDVNTTIHYTVLDVTPQQQQKKVQFHTDDLNLQKIAKKSVFEEMLDLQLDPEENELSDSEEQTHETNQAN